MLLHAAFHAVMALSPQFGMTIVLCANMSGLDIPVPTSSVYPTPKYPFLATRDDILGFYASDPANALPPLGPSALPIVLPVRRRMRDIAGMEQHRGS